jgi:hypothetical protein
MRRLAPLLLLLLGVAADARAETVAEALARGDAAWARRADGFASTGRPDEAAAAAALAAYEDAVGLDPSSLDARFRLLDALWFSGHFLTPQRAQQKRTFNRMASLAEETVARADGGPRLGEAHFWAAISWGLWAMSHGNAASGFKGVAGRIRDHAEALVAIDESFADAGGLRLLGRLHAATPRVPMFTGWIDRERGIEHLRRANAISARDPRNPLFLAEALLAVPGGREEALGLLRDVAARVPDPARVVEEQETIDEARRVLAEAESSPAPAKEAYEPKEPKP